MSGFTPFGGAGARGGVPARRRCFSRLLSLGLARRAESLALIFVQGGARHGRGVSVQRPIADAQKIFAFGWELQQLGAVWPVGERLALRATRQVCWGSRSSAAGPVPVSCPLSPPRPAGRPWLRGAGASASETPPSPAASRARPATGAEPG